MRLLLRRRNHESPIAESTVALAAPVAETAAEPSPFSQGALPEVGPKRQLPRLGLRSGKAPRGQRVAVSLDSGTTRVVILKGSKVVSWGTEYSSEGPAKEDPEDQARRLRGLLNHLGVRRGRVVSDLPMLTSITRVLELPKVHRRYLEQVVVSEVLETIPFSQEEVDLVWQVRRNGTGQEALTFAVPKETVDHHVRVLRNAGIKPKATYSKATALAHAAGVHDGVLAHIGPSEASFVLVVHGVPLIVHRMEFPRDDLSPQEWAEAVSRAVEQVASCHQSLEPKDGGQQLPVVLIGPPVGGDPFVGALKELLQRDLLPFAPPGLCF